MNAAVASPTPILVERRFPLDLRHRDGAIRDLYVTGKTERWVPDRDIPWSKFDPAGHAPDAAAAARLAWSRRAWLEYTGLQETPAVLIRFCLEPGREADPKYFLTVRNTEEAWNTECFHRLAKLFGGFVDQPSNQAYRDLYNHGFHREVLDADNSLDEYVAAHCAFEDGLELELFRAYLDNARDPVVRAVLERAVQAKERHAAFGWHYVEDRAGMLDAEARAGIGAAIARFVTEVEFRGYHLAWLAPDGIADDIAAADEATAAAGLGAADRKTEGEILRRYLLDSRAKLATVGIDLPAVEHPALGTI